MPEDNPARKSIEAGAKTAREAVDRGTAAAEQATRQAEQSYASISPAHGPSRRRRGIEKSNDWHRHLLRARRERPRGRRAAEQSDEFAADHSMTSSARASSVGGTSRPSALAVLRLI